MLQVVQYKQKLHLEVVKKEALERHLDYIVGTTERYTKDLTTSFKGPPAVVEMPPSDQPDASSVPAEPLPGGLLGRPTPAPVHVSHSVSGTPDAEATAVAPAPVAPDAEATAVAPVPVAPDAEATAVAPVPVASAAVPVAAQTEEDAAVTAKKEAGLDSTDEDFVPSSLPASERVDDESGITAADEPSDAEAELKLLHQRGQQSLDQVLEQYPGYGETGPSAAEEDTDVESGQKRPRLSRSRAEEPETKRAKKAAESRGEGSEDEDEEAEENPLLLLQSPTPSSQERAEKTAACAGRLQPANAIEPPEGVGTPVPFLLKHSLRPYQHVGLDWLANMYNRRLNGMLVSAVVGVAPVA